MSIIKETLTVLEVLKIIQRIKWEHPREKDQKLLNEVEDAILKNVIIKN